MAAVTTLVEHGALLDLQTTSGWIRTTALMCASIGNHPSIVTFLVGMGADQSIKSDGKTALDFVTKMVGRAEVVGILKNPEKVGAVDQQRLLLFAFFSKII